MHNVKYCEDCFKKQQENDKLKDEITRLKQQLGKQKKESKDGYFGSSTPSSQKPFKKNSSSNKNGGAKKGHKGKGRKPVNEQEATSVEHIDCGNECPSCKSKGVDKGNIERSVIDVELLKIKKILYKIHKYYCPTCKKAFYEKPVALPRSLYGNGLISLTATMHYLEGVPVGRIESILGNDIISSSLFDVFHRVGKLFKPVVDKIIQDYKSSEVKHADETSWRTDGDSGYAWLFCSEFETILKFKDTRSAKVPASVFGTDLLPGVLVVDRYAGYNKMPCDIQYCYAHLLRKVEDLVKEFRDSKEITNFVSALVPLLSKAMHLRNQAISDKQFYKEAKELKEKIVKIIESPAKHFGIIDVQNIFTENKKRLYHWVANRKVPPDNNKAEREIRPTVIARKVSYGSQSKQGAETRSILMTVLHTARKRLGTEENVAKWFKDALDRFSKNPNIDPFELLPLYKN